MFRDRRLMSVKRLKRKEIFYYGQIFDPNWCNIWTCSAWNHHLCSKNSYKTDCFR